MMKKSKKQFLFGRADNKEKIYEESKGIIREYYKNGQLRSEGYFENDEPLEQTYYNEKGNKI